MKKFMRLAVLTLLLWMPIDVLAKDQIDNYFINMTVEKNGDITVEELFILDGSFNGYERILNYKNMNAPTFDGSLNAFNGSDIYNADAVIIQEIKSIDVSSSPDFNQLWKEGTVFQESDSADSGDFGVYTVTKTYNGQKIRIYNPSSRGEKGFYIKYKMTNMAVVHNDVAEVGFNLFSDELVEDVANLEMHIHIPENKNELRAWGHGPLWGETENLSQEEIKLTINDLDAQTAVDIRFVFDKPVVLNSHKFSNVDALNSILTVESKKAEEANELREEARNQVARQQKIFQLYCIIAVLWAIGLILFIIRVYLKYDKEYKNPLPSKYYREFPDTYGPEIVGYLLHKQISNDDLSASILNLIYKKAIAYEKTEKKNDYKLINLHVEESTLTESEQKLLKWLFNDNDEIKLSELKKEAKNSYTGFINRYNTWKNETTKEAKTYQFFEKSTGHKIIGGLYSFIGGYFIPTIFFLTGHYIIGILSIIFIIGAFIYLVSYKKRTISGNEAYHKWMGLKNFMVDFGKMDDKELPEIVLWEKYLVYAVSLGCAKQLAKTMEIKVKELSDTGANIPTMTFNPSDMYLWISLNRSINDSVASAISTAHAQQVASSSNSSSGGFGGGFSGGGGSFGGGGGGGRF